MILELVLTWMRQWEIHTGFDARECSAEHIWDAAEKEGRKSVLIKYETS